MKLTFSILTFKAMFVYYNIEGVVVFVIVWKLDLQLHVLSIPITTIVVSSNPTHGEMYSIQFFAINFVSDWQHVGGFLQIFRCPSSLNLTATILQEYC